MVETAGGSSGRLYPSERLYRTLLSIGHCLGLCNKILFTDQAIHCKKTLRHLLVFLISHYLLALTEYHVINLNPFTLYVALSQLNQSVRYRYYACWHCQQVCIILYSAGLNMYVIYLMDSKENVLKWISWKEKVDHPLFSHCGWAGAVPS